MLGYVYGKNHALNTNQDLGVKVATPVGTLCGQLLFGWLADVVGRKRMCMSLYYWPCSRLPHKPS
jgi:PHS family inorganic phosphate transporter-like MFS transporter